MHSFGAWIIVNSYALLYFYEKLQYAMNKRYWIINLTYILSWDLPSNFQNLLSERKKKRLLHMQTFLKIECLFFGNFKFQQIFSRLHSIQRPLTYIKFRCIVIIEKSKFKTGSKHYNWWQSKMLRLCF